MINLTAKLDNDEFQRKLQEMRNTAFGVTNSIVKETQRIETAWQGVANSLKGSEGIGAKLLQGLKPIIPQVEAIRQGVKGIKVDFENIPTVPPLRSMEEATTSAARGFNALNFATQQLVREVPAATMGLHMFFLAISNNLPFFADAIKQVREENKALAASGKPTTSVFKQIISSLFSWQTALIAGITALTLYGKEIGNWVKGLFKGKEAIDAIARSEQTLADIRRQATLDAQEEVVQMQLAVQAMQDNNRSMDERKRAMRTLQEQYPEYFGKLEEEKLLYGEIGESVDALIERMVALATARNSFDKLVENRQNLEILKGMDSYAEFESANAAYEARGRKKRGMMLSGGQYREGVTNQYIAWDKAQKALLKDLKNGGEEAEALFKEISDKYDGDVDAYIKATEESNKKLSEKASGIVTKPDLAEEANNAEDANNQLKREAEERRRILERLNNDLTKDVQRTQRERDDAEIAAIKDGIERKRREIQKGYERRAAEIDKLEADIKKAQGGTLTPEQKEHLTFLRTSNTDTLNAGKVLVKSMQDEVAQEATKAMDEYLISYGTFQEKILAITAKYQRLIANAQNEGERKTLEAERDALLAEYKVQASDWANSLVDMTTAQLNKMLAELQAQVEAKQDAFDALGASDSKDAQKYREEINRLNAMIKILQAELGKTSRKAGDKNWDESVQTFQEIARAANEAADGIAEFDEDLGNSLRSIAQLASSGLNLVVVIKKITEAAWTGANGIKALEKASLILTAISAGIQVVSTLFNLFRQSDEVEETKRQFKELNDELVRLHKLARIDSVEGTIFGPNPFGNFINNLKAMQDALKDFEASKEAIANRHTFYVDYRMIGGLKVYDTYGDLNKSIAKMQVKTKDRNWLGEWWYGSDEYDDLGDLMPDLFDEFGNVTLEGLQKLRESDEWDNLEAKGRELIDQMIADWEDYNAAVEATNKYLSDVFGDLGYTMTNALVDAFENGTDAAQAFGEAASDVIEKLATDMIHAALVQPILDKYQLLIDEANLEEMSPEERIAELTRLIGEMSQEVLAVKGEVDATAAQVRQDAEDAGITGVYGGSGSSSATSKGFQTMSQETGSELNGRFTDIQGQTHRIAEAVEFCKSLHIENLTQVQSINATVAMIHNDTYLIATYTKALVQMKEDLASIRSSIDNGAI